MSNTRGRQAGLDDTKAYRAETWFRFKKKRYQYSLALHMRALSAYVQAEALVNAGVPPADQVQEVTLVHVVKRNGVAKHKRRELRLEPGECKTLLDKCDSTSIRMEKARTRNMEEDTEVDEVEA